MGRDSFELLCVTLTDKRFKKQKFFREIMFDQFGNYIAPKLIERAKRSGQTRAYEQFVKTFNENVDQLKRLRHGRQLVQKIMEAQHGSKKKGKSRTAMSSSSSVTSLMSTSNQSVSQASSHNQ